MYKVTWNQAGFEAIGVIAAVLIIGAVGFTGYTVVHNNKPTIQQPTTAVIAQPAPATIKSQADLKVTSSNLDKSSAQLDSNLNDGSLDADLNSLL